MEKYKHLFSTWNNFSSSVITVSYDLNEFLALAYLMMGLSALVPLAAGLRAPYGRYTRKGWGPLLDSRTAWFIQELPAFAIPMILLIFTDCSQLKYLPNKIVLGIYLLHYVHRVFIYPALMKSGQVSTLMVFLAAVFFCILVGYTQGGFLLCHADFGHDWYRTPTFYVGIMLQLTGMAINIYSDHILRSLRKPGETSVYKIPRGGLFEYVSGANFFGEILEWFGYALATWSFQGVALFVSTACNIGPRAFQHHRYYKEKFDDYPAKRKALIPLII
ncbi:hypothetical protein CHS0354_004329 [Potamilus streckersoni]|uniref:3-oxo-5alpha-steroid 4-dehydrogenase (NADP(+)) n=1 Tax=Potamilus streckersoni TaxID=2493646 RepID=A0AAE0SGG8_9BIVA|nr:hypothetical protein CHS0354_004329 [Potamilus streckersoni]